MDVLGKVVFVLLVISFSNFSNAGGVCVEYERSKNNANTELVAAQNSVNQLTQSLVELQALAGSSVQVKQDLDLYISLANKFNSDNQNYLNYIDILLKYIEQENLSYRESLESLINIVENQEEAVELLDSLINENSFSELHNDLIDLHILLQVKDTISDNLKSKIKNLIILDDLKVKIENKKIKGQDKLPSIEQYDFNVQALVLAMGSLKKSINLLYDNQNILIQKKNEELNAANSSLGIKTEVFNRKAKEHKDCTNKANAAETVVVTPGIKILKNLLGI